MQKQDKIIRVVLLDDEDLALDLMQFFVEKFDGLKIIGRFSNAVEALEFINTHKPDLIFLDIHMPIFSGIDLIKELDFDAAVVLVTAYREYAPIAFDLNVVDYIMKPYEEERFRKATEKAIDFLFYKQMKNSMETKVLYVKKDGILHKVIPSDILFVQGLKQYVKIQTAQGFYIHLESMKNMEIFLNDQGFLRNHKSFIVNTSKVKSYKNNILKVGRFEIPVGRSYKKHIKEYIFNKNI